MAVCKKGFVHVIEATKEKMGKLLKGLVPFIEGKDLGKDDEVYL